MSCNVIFTNFKSFYPVHKVTIALYVDYPNIDPTKGEGPKEDKF